MSFKQPLRVDVASGPMCPSSTGAAKSVPPSVSMLTHPAPPVSGRKGRRRDDGLAEDHSGGFLVEPPRPCGVHVVSRPFEVRPFEDRQIEVCPGEVRPGEVRPIEVRPGEIRSGGATERSLLLREYEVSSLMFGGVRSVDVSLPPGHLLLIKDFLAAVGRDG